jgi:hypothetical protein
MRRILLLAMVAVMMATMLALTAGAASATIHSVTCADEEAQQGTPGAGANPPGISNDDEDAVVDNGTNAEERQPVTSVQGNDTANQNARTNKDCGPEDPEE